MGTPRKLENSFAPTLLQRAAGPKSGPKAEPAKILKSQSEAETLNVSSLGARVAQLELQLAIEQQSRVDMEKRLNQELERLQQLIRDELPPRPDSAQQRASLALSISCPSCPQMGRESDALASGSRADAKAQSPGSEDARADTFPRPASQEKQKVPRLQLTPRTMLRQERLGLDSSSRTECIEKHAGITGTWSLKICPDEYPCLRNLALREQILTLREQAVDAKAGHTKTVLQLSEIKHWTF